MQNAHFPAAMATQYNWLSKSDILGWINSVLGTRLTKIEETASGAIACQLMDALHPGTVPLKKVVS